MAGDDKSLSYHDVLLRNDDVDLLTGPHWLNDQALHFGLEFFGREKFAHCPGLLFIPGATSYLLLSTGPEISPVILEPLDFQNKSLVFFAVNNNPDATIAGGGSHWSLLVFNRHDLTVRHFDSCKGMNTSAAQQLYKALQPMLPNKTEFIQENCPQQQNGYDCGMVVLVVAETLAERFAAAGIEGKETLDYKLHPEIVSQASLSKRRAELHGLILQKAKEQHRK